MDSVAQKSARAADAVANAESDGMRARMNYVEQLRLQRRIKLAAIPYKFVVFLLQAGVQWKAGTSPTTGVIPLPDAVPSLPEDAAILGIQFHPERDQFVVTVASELFDSVPADKWPPFMDPMPRWIPAKLLHVELQPMPEAEVELPPPPKSADAATEGAES